MNNNPYEFRHADDSASTGAMPQVCPQFPIVIQVRGEIDETEALRLAKSCKALPSWDLKTGKPVKVLDGRIVLAVIGAVPLCVGASLLISDFSKDDVPFDVLLSWITNALVPLVSVVIAFLILRRNVVRLEAADPPIGSDVEIEFHSSWFAATRKTRDGKLARTMYPWTNTKVLASNEAWLLNNGVVNPLLIVRRWLTADQQAMLDQFLQDLNKWQSSPNARSEITDPQDVFPPLPYEGLSFQISRNQYSEFQNLMPKISRLFPQMPGTSFWSKSWVWMSWGMAILLIGAIQPAYVFVTGEGRIAVGFILPIIIGWLMYKFGKGMNNVADYVGLVTDTTLWLSTKTMRTSIAIDNYTKCQRLENAIVLSTENTITPMVILRSSFATESDWEAARATIEANAD